MTLAIEHFEADGFDVTDVSSHQPYDLRCTKGSERVDVAVKGTTTTPGETVLLTPNEVQHALTRYPHTALAVVHGVVLEGAGTPTPTATGGTLEVHQPWRALEVDLNPLGYTYSVPTGVSQGPARGGGRQASCTSWCGSWPVLGPGSKSSSSGSKGSSSGLYSSPIHRIDVVGCL